MNKHADSLDFVHSLINDYHQHRQLHEQQQARQRSDSLRPSRYTNSGAMIATMLPNIPLMRSVLKTPPVAATDIAGIRDIVARSGLDLRVENIDPSTHISSPTLQALLKNYGYDNTKHLGSVGGRHGSVIKIGPEAEKWSIPLVAHEVGHAQIEDAVGKFPRSLQHMRSLGTLGLFGNLVESYRALDNNKRPLNERKQMLDRASAISGIASVPTLANEWQASARGMKFLKTLPLANKEEILGVARKAYPKAFSTYALMAAAPTLAPQIAKLFLPKNGN